MVRTGRGRGIVQSRREKLCKTGFTGLKNLQFREPLAELNKTVTPVTSGVHKTLKNLDSGFRRNDVEGLLQEALGI
jgi:hypothetical protein